jgi:hypothetical protein
MIGSDRIGAARRLLITMLLLTAVGAATVAIDSSLRTDVPHTADISLFHFLGLSYPALVPSGRLLRHPDFARTGVDLRFSPTLPRYGTDPALLILPYLGDGSGP